MIGWITWIGAALILLLLGRTRLGGEAEYSRTGLLVKVRVGWLRIQVFPIRKEREKKPPESGREKPEREATPQSGGPLEQAKRYLPLICEAAGELKDRIRVDRLYLELAMATPNAAGTAVTYGYANMALGMLWPMIEQNFEVKDPRLHTKADFSARSSTVYLAAAFSARLGQLVSFGLRFGWKFIGIYRKNGNPIKTQKEAI